VLSCVFVFSEALLDTLDRLGDGVDNVFPTDFDALSNLSGTDGSEGCAARLLSPLSSTSLSPPPPGDIDTIPFPPREEGGGGEDDGGRDEDGDERDVM
jgi:hypothetical protein